ncbi:MAG: dienelactone hydrolase family protein [Deltaproteobacteria bacterium]|nr:dienelactone hydrolase family protein [Deltaproteobacteria bacterium]
MRSIRLTLLILVLAALAGCASLITHETLRFEGFETTPKHFSGILTLPKENKESVPVVVLVHGSAGVDSRYAFHRPALLDAGIGTFEVDFKTGVFTSLSDRPPIATFQPWAFGALKVLRSHPRVDAKRIAIMGFSLGGHLSVSVASRKVVTQWLGPGQPGFAAHVGFYPVCKELKKHFDVTGLTGAPILIISGEKDSWGDGETCGSFCDWLNEAQPGVVSLTMYPDVHHGFDRKGSWKGYAPFAQNNTAILQWDAEAAHDSRKRAVAFLRQAFGL